MMAVTGLTNFSTQSNIVVNNLGLPSIMTMAVFGFYYSAQI